MGFEHTNDVTAAEVNVLVLKAGSLGIDQVSLGKHLKSCTLYPLSLLYVSKVLRNLTSERMS